MRNLMSWMRRRPSASLGAMTLVFWLMANAAAQAVALGEGESQPFSLLGYQGDFAVYRAELTTPPVTLSLYLHQMGGGLLVIKNRVLPNAVASVALGLETANGSATVATRAPVAAARIETRVIGQTRDGGTAMGVFLGDDDLTTIIILDRQGRFVKAINVSS